MSNNKWNKETNPEVRRAPARFILPKEIKQTNGSLVELRDWWPLPLSENALRWFWKSAADVNKTIALDDPSKYCPSDSKFPGPTLSREEVRHCPSDSQSVTARPTVSPLLPVRVPRWIPRLPVQQPPGPSPPSKCNPTMALVLQRICLYTINATLSHESIYSELSSNTHPPGYVRC